MKQRTQSGDLSRRTEQEMADTADSGSVFWCNVPGKLACIY